MILFSALHGDKVAPETESWQRSAFTALVLVRSESPQNNGIGRTCKAIKSVMNEQLLWSLRENSVSEKALLLCIISYSDVTCRDPPLVDNADIVEERAESYLPGHELHYQCQEGFEIPGSDTIRCENKKWSTPPRCEGRHLYFLQSSKVCVENLKRIEVVGKWREEKLFKKMFSIGIGLGIGE